jgi:hypothetical protein
VSGVVGPELATELIEPGVISSSAVTEVMAVPRVRVLSADAGVGRMNALIEGAEVVRVSVRGMDA